MALAVHDFRYKARKGNGAPYVTHLLMVCAIVGEHGGDEDQLIAALLHDWLEDIDGSSPAHLEREFGGRVRALVLALSDTTTRPKAPWDERKRRYVAHLRGEPAEVKLICAADKLHNCRSLLRDHRELGDTIFERFNPAKDQTLWYYRACCDALGEGWAHPLLDELRETVEQLHRASGVPFPR